MTKPWDAHGRLIVSANRRYLQHEDGTPFFWLADTAWELFHRLTREEAEHFLEVRAQQGFTVIQAVALAEFDGVRTPNRYGHTPLLDADPTRPDLQPDGYWSHVDWVIQKAAEKGLYIALLPTWGDKVSSAWGAGPVIFNPENAHVYGKWIGERYGKEPNVLWVNGGDRDPKDHLATWRALAHGVRAGEPERRLMTFHPQGGQGSSKDWHGEDWIDFHMWQSGHYDFDLRSDLNIDADWNRTNPIPVLDGEPNYEHHHPFIDMKKPMFGSFDVRRASYWTVFAGACGITYGCHAIWQFYSPLFPAVNHPFAYWQESLHLTGAQNMRHLKELMLGLPYFDRVPDQSLITSGLGEGGETIRATRDSQGRYALIYVPTWREFTVDYSKLNGNVEALWMDPRSGAKGAWGEGPTFQPPSREDWVLILTAKA